MARFNSISGFFNYKVVQGFRSKPSITGDCYIGDSCIQIEEIRINRSISIPHRINFRLDLATLKQLEAIKNSNQKLRLSPTKIANLRCYVLHHVFIEQQLITNPKFQGSSLITRSPLTFSTHYAWASQQSTILLRSAIDLQGKISQHIQQDLYRHREMLARISQVHYWLISELLALLPLKCNRYSWLVLACSFLVATLVGLISWYLFPFNKLLDLIIAFSVFWLLNTSFKKTIAELIKSWLIYHLIEGILAKNAIKRQIGFKLLSSFL